MNDVLEQSPWSLVDLFSAQDSPEMQTCLQQVEAQVVAFEARREELSADLSAQVFLDWLHQLEAIYNGFYRVDGFASLRFAADTQDQAAQTFLARIEQLSADLQNRTLFFSLWWKSLDDVNAERLMAVAGDYRYWLEEMRHFKPHTLSEAEEKIINLKDVTGARALTTLYDALTNRYLFHIQVEGEEKELTRGELMVYARHHDADLRARAYQELYKIYGQDGSVLAQIYSALVRDWRNEQVGLRHYASPIAARNLVNDIPNQVVDTLLEVCRRNAVHFQRFFRIKAQRLGIQRLRRYDVYAPIAQSNKLYTFSTAVDKVLDAFQRFDGNMSELARRVFVQKHLDSEIRKGKRSGAFCSTIVPELAPWVLLNYQGRPDDVATMAHELGHAVHSLLAADHSLFTQQACLPLAETASTFGEMLLVDRLLAEENDEAIRRDLLFRQVDDAYATILRQAYFAMFEIQAHEMLHQNAAPNEIAAVYLENLRSQFGDAVEVSDEFRWEWVSIPHFYHVPFYVYAYAFGQLLVFSLYQQYQAEGEAFKPRYLKILSAGGSAAPVNVLLQAGMDVYSADFWQGGFDFIARLVDQLEALP